MYLEMDKTQIAEQFEQNLLDTNRGYNYYIDWENVSGYDKYSVEIHAMDVLIHCEEDKFFYMFKNLLVKIPTVIEVFPILFALAKGERASVVKNANLKVIGENIDGSDFDVFNFSGEKFAKEICEKTILKYYNFFVDMGLKELFQNFLEKSVQDYIVGVLVGMDSNGRKNRGGKVFELACEPMIRQVCEKYKVEVITQKTFEYMEKNYGIKVDAIMLKRKADFILVNEKKTKCMNIEVNFFNDSGSKPEEIINSYIQRQDALGKTNIAFALLTDGKCWKGTTNQLKVGLKELNYLMNYNLAKVGMLEEIIEKEFGKC